MEADPENAQSRQDCASDHELVGAQLLRQGDLAGALAAEDRARELREWVARKDEKNADVRGDMVANYKQLGDINLRLAKRDGTGSYIRAARAWYQRGIETLHQLQTLGAFDQDAADQLKEMTSGMENCDSLLKEHFASH